MKCPFCGHAEQKVLDSRVARGGHAVRRRRECEKCTRRFTTFEESERPQVILIKRDGSREEFSRKKLISGLLIACRKRPVPFDRLQECAEAIERELLDQDDLEVRSAVVGKMALEKLLKIDAVAYVRFASVYEQFETPGEFARLVASLPASSALTNRGM